MNDKIISEDSVLKLNSIDTVHLFRKNQFLVNRITSNVEKGNIGTIYNNAYVSKLYLDSLNNRVFFLPKIILKSKYKQIGDLLVKEFRKKIQIQDNNNGTYKIFCPTVRRIKR